MFSSNREIWLEHGYFELRPILNCKKNLNVIVIDVFVVIEVSCQRTVNCALWLPIWTSRISFTNSCTWPITTPFGTRRKEPLSVLAPSPRRPVNSSPHICRKSFQNFIGTLAASLNWINLPRTSEKKKKRCINFTSISIIITFNKLLYAIVQVLNRMIEADFLGNRYVFYEMHHFLGNRLVSKKPTRF